MKIDIEKELEIAKKQKPTERIEYLLEKLPANMLDYLLVLEKYTLELMKEKGDK